MLTAGQAIKAAQAATTGVRLRELDVRALQRARLRDGFYLGDDARPAKLGLVLGEVF